MKIDYNRHIWEGCTVQGFIDELAPQLSIVMCGNSWREPIKTKEDLKKWCMENQPYYKKYIKEVVEHFADKYSLT